MCADKIILDENSQQKMGNRAKFRYFVAVAALTVVIFVFTMRNMSLPLMYEAKWGYFIHKELENYWILPGNSSSLLPKTNYVIDVYVDLKKLRKQVIENNTQCQRLKDKPFTMFKSRPSNTTSFTAEMDRKRIELAYMCGGVLYPEYLTAPPRKELYPFEAYYLSDPPLLDVSTVACHKHSTVNLYASTKTFRVGDPVSLVIKMFDRKGRPRLKGGDRLKVWLKDVKFNNSISANITDYNNGTYLTTTVLPWAGTVRVMATLRQSREFFRALAYVHRTIKTSIPFAGAYNNSQANETVPCNAIPLVPGYQTSELCNLTLQNGSPWFCGRPSKQELSCSDYQFVTYWRSQIPMPVTPAEDEILKQRHHLNQFFPGNITLTVEASKSGLTRLPDPTVPCNKVSPRATWHQSEPTGYFYNGVWKSFLCFLPDPVWEMDKSCSKNITMFFYGDSNSRLFYERITYKTKCRETLHPGLKEEHKVCENEKRNITLHFAIHASPYNTGWGEFTKTSNLYPPQKLFRSVPSEGRYIISFNHYLHFSAHHISVYERTLRAVRDEIMGLLKRNPHGQILLRGPHVAEREPFVYYVGDVWGQYITAIQKETFRDLQDRILYFPTWDITVASEDTDVHPACNNNIYDSMLNFVCGRDE